MEIDLLNQDPEHQQGMHKLKKLVKTPDSFFMDVKCPQCQTVNTIFSNAQKVILCTNCKYLLAVPRGGKTKLAVGTAWRRKGNWGDNSWSSIDEWIRTQKLYCSPDEHCIGESELLLHQFGWGLIKFRSDLQISLPVCGGVLIIVFFSIEIKTFN